jgi:hypothetical protein
LRDVGRWALGIAGAFGVIMRDPYVDYTIDGENKWADHSMFAGIKVWRD